MPETEYEGLPIRKHSMAVRGASGDALSGVLKVKPYDFKPGVPVYVLVEAMPTGVRHDPMDDGDAWDLVQITKVQRGTLVDGDLAVPLLDEVTIALEDLRVEQTGQAGMGNGSLAVEADHNNGLHKRRRRNCELCQNADPLGVGDGKGDPDNPLPAARKYRTKKPAKKS